MYQDVFKRVLDVVVSLLALAVLSPIMLLAAIAVSVDDGFPVLFRQVRVGRNNSTFRIYKFRSMPTSTPPVASANAHTFKITRVGAFLRRSNIDELPQLFNVIFGTMSLVGPRPGLASQIELMALRRACGVDRLRPGLTGLAQVNSFDGMNEERKVEWEARYAARITLLGDLAIMLRTVGYLFRRPPVY
jgi:O-antigen biosynthesis protein WbqP